MIVQSEGTACTKACESMPREYAWKNENASWAEAQGVEWVDHLWRSFVDVGLFLSRVGA